MRHTNPCPNPNIPPLRIELSDIPCNESDEHYPMAVSAVKAYWRQATNMTIEDQIEYKGLVENKDYYEQGASTWFSAFLAIWSLCETSPTWAKFVFLEALYYDTLPCSFYTLMQSVFESLKIEDFEKDYRTHNPEPARVKKRKATEQLHPPEAKLKANRNQPNASSPLGQPSPVIGGQASPVNNQPLTQRDLERLENRLKEHIDGRIKRIREGILAMFAEHTES
ncbi:hypothetical protein ACSS6W_006063 [Trichoderma asperelloides]